jgi:histidinol-phosphatase (PHP family)
VIGHIGVYKRYLGRDFFTKGPLASCIKEVEDELARLCANSDKIIEVNSSGLFSPFSAAVPDTGFLKAYYRYGGRNISAGSDAHCARDVGRGIEAVHDLLRETGFKHTLLPWDREHPQMLSITGNWYR